ncbi:hypothetical protein TNCV_4253731 [Trichonephila clavipes]|nr:hypothetical protein TNCV_4253731 [Trichonephila clavipes]
MPRYRVNSYVTCMVLKATVDDRRHLALSNDEFRGPSSGLCRSGGFGNNNNVMVKIVEFAGGAVSFIVMPLRWRLGEALAMQSGWHHFLATGLANWCARSSIVVRVMDFVTGVS